MALAHDEVAGARTCDRSLPSGVLPTSAVFTKLVDLGFGLLILGTLMIYYGQPLPLTALWLPVLLRYDDIYSRLSYHWHTTSSTTSAFSWVTLTSGLSTPVIYPVDLMPENISDL
jgi:ABC-type polysaccharide/polyol phosphate export permease